MIVSVDQLDRHIVRLQALAVEGDDEKTHIEEILIRHQVLRSIANGWCANPQEMARTVLRTSDINFHRGVSL